jgi:hypothetical protein
MLNRNLLERHAIRNVSGGEHGSHLVDLDGDTLQDVYVASEKVTGSAVWNNIERRWGKSNGFPDEAGGIELNAGPSRPEVGFFLNNGSIYANWRRFDVRNGRWDPASDEEISIATYAGCKQRPSGFFHRDINADGKTEAFDYCGGHVRIIWGREGDGHFENTKLRLPSGSNLVAGLRLVDVNGDGKLDCLFANAERYSLHLFKDMHEGWSIKVIEGVRGQEGGMGPEIPPFVRADGTNNGAFFHSKALWTINEDTARFPNHAFKLTFAEMLK